MLLMAKRNIIDINKCSKIEKRNYDKISWTTQCNTTLWGIKTHQNFFHHNLKKSDPILINFGTNIPDTTGY